MKITIKEDGKLIIDGEGTTVLFGSKVHLEGYKADEGHTICNFLMISQDMFTKTKRHTWLGIPTFTLSYKIEKIFSRLKHTLLRKFNNIII